MTAFKLAGFRVLVLLAVAAAPLTARAQDEGPVVTPSTEPPPAPADVAAPPAPPAPAEPAPPAPSAPPAPAPSYPPPLGPPAPAGPAHGGFFLRMHFGFGFISLTGSGTNVPTTKISGHGPTIGIALGGNVVENLAVYGTLFDTIANEPDETTGGIDGGNMSGTAGLVGVGCGAVYYFEPINLYVSGTLAVISMDVEDQKGNSIDGTTPGYGLDAMVGKEWWVSRHWGLGLAAQLILATGMQDTNDIRVGWTGAAANLVFSGTYF